MPDQALWALVSAVVSSLLTAALTLFLKDWIGERIKARIKHEYDAQLEVLRSANQVETAVAVEKVKSELQMRAHEYQIRYSRLHTQQAECVAEIDSKLEALMSTCANYFSYFGEIRDDSRKGDRDKVMATRQEFLDYFIP